MSATKASGKRPLQILVRYLSEIVVIFLGITISFAFDQWNRDRELKQKEILYIQSLLTDLELKKNELLEDSPSAIRWINRLDSIDQNRFSESPDSGQLHWLHGIIITGDMFFFNAATPSFSPTHAHDLWQELPDSIRRSVYNLYLVNFGYVELSYTGLRQTMTSFRNAVVIPSGFIATSQSGNLPNTELRLFARELRNPAYHNFLREMIAQEQILYETNHSSMAQIEKVLSELRSYLAALQH